MSYIYEALKRAEDENAKGVAVPRLARRAAFFAARPRWWLWALIGVLGANAALLVALGFFPGSRSPDVTMPTSTEPVTGPVAAAPPTDAHAARVTPSPPPAITPEAAPAVAHPAPPVPPSVTPARPAPAPGTSAARPSVRPVPPARGVADRPATPADPRAVPAPQAPPPATAARETADARPTSARPAAPVSQSAPVASPPAGDVAPRPAVEAPKLHVQVVVYSADPAERMVFIDGRRYAEGQNVDAETVIERITPDGAVVTRRGQRFTLTSGRP
jgi:hypothetical protein